jgi:hypothetical protein
MSISIQFAYKDFQIKDGELVSLIYNYDSKSNEVKLDEQIGFTIIDSNNNNLLQYITIANSFFDKESITFVILNSQYKYPLRLGFISEFTPLDIIPGYNYITKNNFYYQNQIKVNNSDDTYNIGLFNFDIIYTK